MEKEDKSKLLSRIERDLSDLKETERVIQGIIEKLESQAKRLRYQRTLTTED